METVNTVEYKLKSVCYLDILGFRALVEKKEALDDLVQKIRSVNEASDLRKFEKYINIEKIQVSDGLLFWASTNSFQEMIIFVSKIGFTIAEL